MAHTSTSHRYTIIASTPRSGSSWLSRLLRSHPSLNVYTHNTGDNYRLYLLQPLRALNPWSDDAARGETRSGLRVRALRSLFPPSADGRITVIQTPTLGVLLPHLIEAFPDARFVHLQRDPLDTIVSLGQRMSAATGQTLRGRFRTARYRGRVFAIRAASAHAFHALRWARCPHPGYLFARPTGFQGFARLPLLDFLTRYYAAYESDIRSSLAQVPPHQMDFLTYESLVHNFEASFGRLLKFIGVSPGDALRVGAATIRTGSVGRHRAELSSAEIDRIRSTLRELPNDPI